MNNLDKVFGGKISKDPKPGKEKIKQRPEHYVTLSIHESTWQAVLKCQSKLMDSGKRLKKYEIVSKALEVFEKTLY